MPAGGTDWRHALRHLAGEIRGIILRRAATAPLLISRAVMMTRRLEQAGREAGDVVLDVEIARKERDSAKAALRAGGAGGETGERQRGEAGSLLEDSGRPG
jgi:hypothetical protein